MSIAIETRQLTRNFGNFCAVNHIDLVVESGMFFGFLGPNGAGKSTTIKMLTGLLSPSAGELILLGSQPKNAKETVALKRRIGVVPDGLALFDFLTAREYLTFIGRMYELSPDTIKTRSEELLSALALEAGDDKLCVDFSHGMKKKLALAAALLPNPDLLFLDEPFEGVDAVTCRAIKDMLTGFVARGSTVFLTSHVLDIVERLCTHVGIIAKGKLVEQSSLADLSKGGSLEQRFLEIVGHDAAQGQKISWLEGATA